jgi:hypothetical protein
MTDDYKLHLAMMERRLNDMMNPPAVDEIRDDLNLRFVRLNLKSNENGNNQDVAFFGGQFKGTFRNCGVIGHKARDCKNKFCQNGGQNSGNQNGGKNGGNQNNIQGNSSNGAYCTYCRQPGHLKGNCFKLKDRSNHNSGTYIKNNQE